MENPIVQEERSLLDTVTKKHAIHALASDTDIDCWNKLFKDFKTFSKIVQAEYQEIFRGIFFGGEVFSREGMTLIGRERERDRHGRVSG
jgi:hypothetical protein